jgi:hypothetical protein
MVLARGRGRSYALWAFVCVATAAAFFAWHLWLCRKHGRALTGSSPAAFFAGVVAAAIMLFETMLALRKRLRRVPPRFLGLVRWWLHAHLWLGLLTLPLVAIHTGGFTGGPFSIALLAAFGAVWASGVVGWVLQQRLPTKLLVDAPHETVASAFPIVVDKLLERAKKALPVGDVDHAPVWVPKPFAVGGGAESTIGLLLRTSAPPRTLADFYERVLCPFLRSGDARSPLADPTQAEVVLNGLIESSNVPSAAAATLWRRLCDERRDLDRQRRLHSMLHAWLMIHVPATIALLVLLGGHVVVAWRHAVWQGG